MTDLDEAAAELVASMPIEAVPFEALRRRATRRRRRRRAVRVGSVLSAVAATLVLGVPALGHHRDGSVVTTTGGPTRSLSPRPCSPRALAITVGPATKVGADVSISVTFRNTSTTPCILPAVEKVAMVDANEQTVVTAVPPVGARAVTLPAGSAASSSVRWAASTSGHLPSSCAADALVAVRSLAVTVPGATKPIVVSVVDAAGASPALAPRLCPGGLVVGSALHVLPPVETAPQSGAEPSTDVEPAPQEPVFAGSNVWVVSARGDLLRSSNNGKSWTVAGPRSIAHEHQSVTVGFANSTFGWLNTGEHLYLTYDGGSSWSIVGTPFFPDWVQFDTPSLGWILGSRSQLAETTNGGASWTSVATPGATQSACSSAPGEILIVVTRPTIRILVSQDFGAHWSQPFSAPQMASESNLTCATTSAAAIVDYYNGGAAILSERNGTWKVAATGATFGPAGATTQNPYGDAFTTDSGRILGFAYSTNGFDLFAINGGVVSYPAELADPDHEDRLDPAINFRDAGHGIAVVTSENDHSIGVAFTADGGASWSTSRSTYR